MLEAARELRGRAAIVAMGITEQGELTGRTADQIAVEAFRMALVDAQLKKSEIDGLITCRSCTDSGVRCSWGISHTAEIRFKNIYPCLFNPNTLTAGYNSSGKPSGKIFRGKRQRKWSCALRASQASFN